MRLTFKTVKRVLIEYLQVDFVDEILEIMETVQEEEDFIEEVNRL